ncbi:MAG: Uma2 family endonuclease [Cyclobacteriaceae bacterium]
MPYITDISQLDQTKRYTYADYLTWQFQDRVEIIVGKIFRMSPAPSTEHQQIVSALHFNIYDYLRKKNCKAFPSPFDVTLPSPSGIVDTVVHPDITVICDQSKITERGCSGAPDLVIEVVSKSSIRKDLHEKYFLYEQCGIKEYWIVHPGERSLIIFTLNNEGVYQASKPLTRGDKVVSNVIGGLELQLDEIFSDTVEEPEEGYGGSVKRL